MELHRLHAPLANMLVVSSKTDDVTPDRTNLQHVSCSPDCLGQMPFDWRASEYWWNITWQDYFYMLIWLVEFKAIA